MQSNIDNVANAAYSVGLRGDSLVTAIAIAGAESGYRLDAYNPEIEAGGSDGSYGPWQVYLPAHPNYTAAWLTSSYSNSAQAMYEISGGGSNWMPWSTYWNGAYLTHMSEAQDAASRATGDVAGGTGSGTTVTQRADNLSEPFGSRIDKVLADHPGMGITSGFRSSAEQAELYQRYLDGTGNLAAPPGSSKHEIGQAVDLNWQTEDQINDVHNRAAEYGIAFPVAGEPWHAEPIEGDGYVPLAVGAQMNESSVKGVKGFSIPGVGSLSAASDAISGINSFFKWFTDFRNWIRLGMGATGVVLALIGLGVMFRKPAMTYINAATSAVPIPKGAS